MTTLPPAVVGDVSDFRNVILSGIQDLDNVTAQETHIWQTGGAATTLTTSIVDSDLRTIRFELGDDPGFLVDTATPGTWLVEYQLTFADGTVLTWPQAKPDVLHIRAQGS